MSFVNRVTGTDGVPQPYIPLTPPTRYGSPRVVVSPEETNFINSMVFDTHFTYIPFKSVRVSTKWKSVLVYEGRSGGFEEGLEYD